MTRPPIFLRRSQENEAMIRNASYQDDLTTAREVERKLAKLPITPWAPLPQLGTHPRDRLTAKERLVVSGVCSVLSVALIAWGLLG